MAEYSDHQFGAPGEEQHVHVHVHQEEAMTSKEDSNMVGDKLLLAAVLEDYDNSCQSNLIRYYNNYYYAFNYG